MNKHSGRSSAPKKARWSTAKKAEAQNGPKKPHRGQAPRSYDDRAPQARGGERFPGQSRDERPRRDDRAPRREFNRDDRAPRRDDRPARPDWNRDDRAPRREFNRDDRAPRREFNRDDRAPRRDDRPARSDWNRDDRAPRREFNRDDRAPRREFNRDDRAPRRDDRPARSDWNRDDRAPRREFKSDDRAPRREFNRDDRAPRREFNRDDRAPRREFNRDDRAPHREQREVQPETPVTIGDDNGFAALGLPTELVGRLARDGITSPFPIQAATIPDALAGRDVLGRGQTGSGKTLSFGLPTLTRLAQKGPAVARRPRALVLVPTRELAMQVSDALEPLAHVIGLRHKLVAGGMPYTTQINALNRGVELLIATPGRLNDLIERGAVELGDVEIAILDEADHMADMGFMPEVTAILDLIPAGGQRLLFSATLDKGIDGLVERYLTDPVTHSTDAATASVTTMEHHVLLIDPMHKKVITAEVANREGRTVVFVRTKLGADRVAEQLREQGVFAAALHGGLNQGARNRVLGAFRDGSLPVLVATDVAARGIHVDDVSVVLQVDPPADHKDYLHRSGRTARAGDKGTVVTLALPHQRKGMERLAREAGLEVTPARVTPGDATLMAATGSRAPSGVPVPEHHVRRLLEGEQRGHRRPPRQGGPRGPRSMRGPRS